MQPIKKIPFLLSWSAFYLPTLLIILSLGLWVFPPLGKRLPQLTPAISFLLLMALYVFIGFFTFTFSISKVALPLYQVDKIHTEESARITMGYDLSKWILYLIYYVLYCIPLAIQGLLPSEVERPLYMAWRILASFLAYRVVAHSWLDEVVLRGQKSKEGGAVIA